MSLSQYHIPKSARDWPWKRFVGDPLALKFAARELDHLARIVKACPRRELAIQAGGNLGLFPKFLAQQFARVLTFEPDHQNYRWLRLNAPELNIAAYEAALGDTAGTVGLSRARRSKKRGIEHAGLVHVSGRGDVTMLRIDDLPLMACDLIMLDCEGYELPILRGAIETIRAYRPVIALEVNQNLGYFGFTYDDVAAFFDGIGYVWADTFKNDRLYVPEVAA